MEDTLLVDWSRAQFALTALYHWLFVPLTLGLSFIVAIMETIYVKTGNTVWKEITKFWMTLFAINFAIGLATGIIMEFEFGTNWSNYSWIVGDIFGAPLAIEGLMAFFMESTFFAIMFFGWNKVSKRMHLASTWLVAIGSNLSALWILLANGWMQHPTGMLFNPDSARFEMSAFWDVVFNPTGFTKFLHTVGSGYVMGSLFVVGISALYILRNKDVVKAKKSIVVGATFGLVTSLFLILSGDVSAHQIAKYQPMKLAAMEGLYHGHEKAGIVAIGQLNSDKKIGDDQDEFVWSVKVPYALSILGFHDMNAFVPGINELVYGDKSKNIESVESKIIKGKIAVKALRDYKDSKKLNELEKADEYLKIFRANEKYLGYGYLKNAEDIVPPVALTFYSFHIMVGLGSWFTVLFFMLLYFTMVGKLEDKRLLLRSALWSIPLGYLAGETGWIVAEVGRQPWAIQDLLPVGMATSQLATGAVQTTFWMFAILFTGLLIAEIKIMFTQVNKGMEEH